MVGALLIAIASVSVGPTSTVSHTGTISTGLHTPGRIAVPAGGGLFVTDQPNDQILQYDAAGALVAAYAVADPMGIATLSDGRVFVSQGDGTLNVFDAAFGLIGTVNPAPLTMVAPNDLAVDATTDELYAVDAYGHQVMVFAESAPLANDWALAVAWGIEGAGLSQFETPQAIAVDGANNRVIVTDTDNYRVQVFSTAGILQFSFGYRVLFLPNSDDGWFARSEGLALDACGNIYVADALFGTVRAFDPTGAEIDPAHTPAITYGTNPGQVRVPMDMLISAGTLYVVSAANATVETYSVGCSVAASSGGTASVPALPTRDAKKVRRVSPPDNPGTIAVAIERGEFSRTLDLNADRQVDTTDLEIAVGQFGVGSVDEFLGEGGVATTTFEAPHVLDLTFACGRCHHDASPDGGMLAVNGQQNLCLSCHTSSGVASTSIISEQNYGVAHPIGIPADQGLSLGPDPTSYAELALHLDNGNIRCGTCHNPHSDDVGSPLLRAPIGNAALCSECHVEGAQWALAGHSHGDDTAFNYPVGPGRESCAKCHSGLGHIDFANGVPQAQRRTDKQVHSCFVCHGVHENGNAHLLRLNGQVTLPGDHVVDAGDDANCMECHNGRYAPNTGHSTPHYLPGAVVLLGLNGIDFGNTIDQSAHAVLAGCVDCHMAATPGTPKDGIQSPGEDKVGGHTFNLVYHDATGTDPDDGFENAPNACGTCHPGLNTVNRTAWGDYDGSGTTDGIQDELTGLLAAAHGAILGAGAVDLGHYPYWDFSSVAPVDDETVRGAVWNYELIENDGSLGVHNVGFAVGLLQATYRELTGMDVPGASLRYSFGPNARRGGLLYDKWWAVNGAATPTGDHLLYPAIGQKTGNTTYRCKECHGWDYIGDLGRYESGSHFTGIMGVSTAAATWNDQEMFDIIKNPDGDGTGGTTVNGHNFAAYGLSDFDILDLVEFLKTEVVDTSPYINRAGVPGAYSYTFNGEVGNGFGLYSGGSNANAACYACHGADGRTLDFGGGVFVGTLANDNPQEVLHKIRFGQPTTAMTSFVKLGLSPQDAADVGAYAETLPTAAAVGGDVVRGGLLYDKWWAVNGAPAPTVDSPIWALQSTNTRSGSTTYRCKECHGWDYKGAAGAYGSGSHFTGFTGILNTAMTQAELVTFLTTGTYPDASVVPDHVIADLTATDIDDLAAFMATELVDTDLYIDFATKAFINPDLGNGFGYYSGQLDGGTACYLCHGADGRTLDFGGGTFIGTVANGNPWEALHKTRFGQPGTGMCSLVQRGHTAQDAADVSGYTQTLPAAAAVGGDVVRGGLLYDKWWAVNGAPAPTVDSPIWALQSTNTRSGSTTYRCKECHGWDYKGAAGAYGSGSHFTGFTGILNTAMNQAELVTFLTTGTYPDATVVPDHVIADLTATDIDDLAAFVATELVDADLYIDFATKAFIGTGVPDGQDLFTGVTDPVSDCTLCHGVDGTAIDFGGATYVGTVANGNPWEMLHKVRFGQPASAMPSHVRLGLTTQQAADLGVWAQTLP